MREKKENEESCELKQKKKIIEKVRPHSVPHAQEEEVEEEEEQSAQSDKTERSGRQQQQQQPQQ